MDGSLSDLRLRDPRNSEQLPLYTSLTNYVISTPVLIRQSVFPYGNSLNKRDRDMRSFCGTKFGKREKTRKNPDCVFRMHCSHVLLGIIVVVGKALGNFISLMVLFGWHVFFHLIL